MAARCVKKPDTLAFCATSLSLVQQRGTRYALYALMTTKRPEIGQLYKVYGVLCRIVKVRAFGTLDVVTLDGTKAYRVSGLPFN